MGFFPPEIVKDRAEQLKTRVEGLNTTETKHYSFQLAALGIVEIVYVGAFATGVITDTIKASAGRNNGPTLKP